MKLVDISVARTMRQVVVGIASVAVVLACGFKAGAQSADSSDSSEYLMKAGFIYNFAKLVEWPNSAFPQSGNPIVIAVLGNDSFADVLDHVVDGKKIDSHP